MGTLKIIQYALCISALLFSACRYSVPPVIVADGAQVTVEATSEILEMPGELFLPVLDPSEAAYRGLNKAESVFEFYRTVNNHPVWIADGRNRPLADSMLVFIRRIRYYGLLPENYHNGELGVEKDSVTREDLLRREVLLTDAFLNIAKDIRSGRLPGVDARRDSVDRVVLQNILKGVSLKEHLEWIEPNSNGYRSLKHGLRMLLDSAGETEYARLMGGITDDSLALHQKIQALEINMERWRWEKTDLGDRYIFINIPAFIAEVVSGDTLALESRVIVGTQQNQTPLLSSTVECIITYPYWHVPRKIAVEELLPMIQNDSTYIERQNFDVLDGKGRLLNPDSVNWDAFHKNYFPVRLRQREGTNNSLGIIKFVFDNPYAVYLHDTNAKRLFHNKVRAYSHGCIRIEKARELAHYLLTGDIHQTSAVLDAYLEQAVKHTLDIPVAVPIHVRYFTAAARGQELLFYKDIYKKDQALINDLYKRGTPITTSRMVPDKE